MRAKLLVLACSIGLLGWGAVLPYQYAYVANTRGWGVLAAALAGTMFSVGALVAAPFAGHFSDRFNPVTVAVLAQLLAAVGAGALAWANSAATFLTGMFVFGCGVTAASPATSVLVLHWAGIEDRRRVFAYKFTGHAVGMAVGAFSASRFVDLSRTDGMTYAFITAAGSFAMSAAIIYAAGIGAPDQAGPDFAARCARVGTVEALRRIITVPALRWTVLVTVTLALGFYAQFETGLPAYALTVLDVDEGSIGVAAAVNCVVIVALQMVVVRVTAARDASSLLMVVGGIWALAWIVLSLAQLTPEVAAAIFVTTFGIFAAGETMYAAVLTPLIAGLAPSGLVGSTLGTFTAIQTTFLAVGPLLAGGLLGLGFANGYLGLHLVINLVAVYGAWRLRRVVRCQPDQKPAEVVAMEPVDASRSHARLR